jgi:hypothetical protein
MGGHVAQWKIAARLGYKRRDSSALNRHVSHHVEQGFLQVLKGDEGVPRMLEAGKQIDRPITGENVLALVRREYPDLLGDFLNDVDSLVADGVLRSGVRFDSVWDWDAIMQLQTVVTGKRNSRRRRAGLRRAR